MFLDNSLIFSSFTSPVALTTTADSSVIDITGAGVGVAPTMIGGNGGVIGADIGAGDGEAVPAVIVNIGTTLVGGTSLQISLKAAPALANNTEGTYTTLLTTAAIPTASLVAGEQITLPIPQRIPGEALPRFYKLTYTIVGTYTGGTVSAGIVLNPISTFNGIQYPNNFIAA